MKADVFPPTTPLELDIPPWVPEPVAQYVRAEYAAKVRRAYEAAIRQFETENDEVADMLAEQDEVRAIYADFVHDDLVNITERYQPLVCDPRMRGVWRELSRRHKGNGAFYRPARAPSTADAN